MKLYVLDNGSLDGRYTIFYPEDYEDKRNVVFPVHMFLIKTDDGKNVLFDAGINPGGIRANTTSYRYQSEEQTLWKQLALCGVSMDDIDAVVLSHMHYDHAGNLSFLQGKDIYVAKAEYDAAMSNPGGAYYPPEYEGLDLNWKFIESDGEIFKGVEAVMLPGHTKGMLGLVVHLAGGVIILPQDAVYSTDNYYPKKMIPGIMSNLELYLNSMDKVARLQKKYDATIFFGHDKEQHKQLRLAPEYYE